MKIYFIVYLALIIVIPNVAHTAEIIKPEPIRYVGVTYPDLGSSIFLKEVLTTMNLPFTEKATPEGQYIKWESNNESQELEIRNRVSQYYFIKMHCKDMALPSPSSPALKDLSCRGQ